jgi:hypothetical protein
MQKIKTQPFAQSLTLVFITLKLCGIIHWSWWLVLAPIWGGALLVALVLAAESVIKK